MTSRSTPKWLHDVFGEHFKPVEVVIVLAFGIGVATTVMLAMPGAGALPLWRAALAWLVVADIASGCLANFTVSTNDFYAGRPTNRWLFIAAHAHVVVVAWAVRADLQPALGAWAYTIGAASIVNGLAGRQSQRFVAGALLAGALVGLPLSGTAAPLLVVYALFVLKVAYAFAVDHGARDGVSSEPDGVFIRALSHRDRSAFVSVIGAAFVDDPLFVALLGHGASRVAASQRYALVGYLFDMNHSVDGTARGLFVDGRLVGAMLVEPPPRSRLLAVIGLLAAAARYVPVSLRLGSRPSKRLNDYFRDTRAAAPRAPHHYLAMVGVRSDRQGLGFGRRLVEDAIAQARSHARSIGLALDTENPDNVRIYARWGFVEGEVVALDDLRAYTMFRPREAARADPGDGETDLYAIPNSWNHAPLRGAQVVWG